MKTTHLTGFLPLVLAALFSPLLMGALCGPGKTPPPIQYPDVAMAMAADLDRQLGPHQLGPTARLERRYDRRQERLPGPSAPRHGDHHLCP